MIEKQKSNRRTPAKALAKVAEVAREATASVEALVRSVFTPSKSSDDDTKPKGTPKMAAKKKTAPKKKYGATASTKVEKTMHERKHGTLRSGSGQKVKSKKQAIAIGLSEARAAGGKVPSAPKKKSSASAKTSPKKKTAPKKKSSSPKKKAA
ncbi:hypothetical protein BH09MYX1_BH09MYX1_35910 [soil metagenome]